MIRKILFPVDFSPSCTAMAAYVQRAAALCGATVSLVHVCDLASHSGFELYARPGNEIAEEHWNIAREKLEQFLIAEFPRRCKCDYGDGEEKRLRFDRDAYARRQVSTDAARFHRREGFG